MENKEIVETPPKTENEDNMELVEYPDSSDEELVNLETTLSVKKIVKLDLKREKYIPVVITATGEQSKIVCSTKIRLFIGRLYYLPVNLPKEISSENVKTTIDLIDKIDVRMIKDGFACIIPLIHNVVLQHNQRIAIIS